MHNYYSHILKVPFENSPGSGIVYIWIGRFVSQLLITLFFPFSIPVLSFSLSLFLLVSPLFSPFLLQLQSDYYRGVYTCGADGKVNVWGEFQDLNHDDKDFEFFACEFL